MNPSTPASQLWLRRGLGVVGALAVGYTFVRLIVDPGIAPVALVAMSLSLLAWLALLALPRTGTAAIPAFVVLIVGGAIAATATNGLGIAAAAVGVVWLARDPDIPIGRAIWFTVGAMLIVPLGALIAPVSWLGVLAMEAGVAVAFLSGQSRRQYRRAEVQARELLETRIAVQDEQARIDLLASRQQIAHDIHDVLAHSLGGLVIQLDAVDALLEAGDTGAARQRIRDARTLAADGLGDARRAVTALRESPEDSRRVVDAGTLVGDLDGLVEVHRRLGGVVDFAESGERRSIGEPLAAALRRALQESLTNARRHAPTAPVRVCLEWTARSVSMTVDNPLGVAVASGAGGGHGLAGMRERFERLAGGSATAEREGDSFVVRVQGETA